MLLKLQLKHSRYLINDPISSSALFSTGPVAVGVGSLKVSDRNGKNYLGLAWKKENKLIRMQDSVTACERREFEEDRISLALRSLYLVDH